MAENQDIGKVLSMWQAGGKASPLQMAMAAKMLKELIDSFTEAGIHKEDTLYLIGVMLSAGLNKQS
ncbi:MAG: hypothetical protein GXY32_05530 [Ruminococcaceae bacterium]|nr:hypothetical protein [Oscillospiraceae bacterium]